MGRFHMHNNPEARPEQPRETWVVTPWSEEVASAWRETSAWQKIGAMAVMLALVYWMMPVLAFWVMVLVGLAQYIVTGTIQYFWRSALALYSNPWAVFAVWAHRNMGPMMGLAANIGFMVAIFTGWRSWNQQFKAESEAKGIELDIHWSTVMWDVVLKTLTTGAGVLYLVSLMRMKQLYVANMWLNVFSFGVFYQGVAGAVTAVHMLHLREGEKLKHEQWLCESMEAMDRFMTRLLGTHAQSPVLRQGVIFLISLGLVRFFPMDYVFHGWILWTVVENGCCLHESWVKSCSRFLVQLSQMLMHNRYIDDWENPSAYTQLPENMYEKLTEGCHQLSPDGALIRAFSGVIKVVPLYFLISQAGGLTWVLGSAAGAVPLWPTVYSWSMPFYYCWMLIANQQAWLSMLYSPFVPVVGVCVGAMLASTIVKATLRYLCQIEQHQSAQLESLQSIVDSVRDGTVVMLMFQGLFMLASGMGAASGLVALTTAVWWLYRLLLLKAIGDGMGLFCAQKMRFMRYDDTICDGVENVSGWVLVSSFLCLSYPIIPPFVHGLWQSWAQGVNHYSGLAWLMHWREQTLSVLWPLYQKHGMHMLQKLWPYIVWLGEITGLGLLLDMTLFLIKMTGISSVLHGLWHHGVVVGYQAVVSAASHLTPANIGLWMAFEGLAVLSYQYLQRAYDDVCEWIEENEDSISVWAGYGCLATGAVLVLGVGGYTGKWLQSMPWVDVAKGLGTCVLSALVCWRLFSIYDIFVRFPVQRREHTISIESSDSDEEHGLTSNLGRLSQGSSNNRGHYPDPSAPEMPDDAKRPSAPNGDERSVDWFVSPYDEEADLTIREMASAPVGQPYDEKQNSDDDDISEMSHSDTGSEIESDAEMPRITERRWSY